MEAFPLQVCCQSVYGWQIRMWKDPFKTYCILAMLTCAKAIVVETVSNFIFAKAGSQSS